MGSSVIDWTARAAVGCFLARLLLTRRRSGGAEWAAMVVWAAGWLLLAAHTVCAFHLRHHWSHAEASAHTARRTFEQVGWDWGGGLWFNYATLAVWGADVIVLWRARTRDRAPSRWWTRLAVGWVGFMILNATLVFGPRWWWAVGTCAAVVYGYSFVRVKCFDLLE